MKNISSSLEDYIEAIAEIIDKKGHAHTKDIAERLEVKMPSVTKALQLLAQKNLIIYKSHQPVELTEEGKKIGVKVRRRHRILNTFFAAILSLEKETAEKNACQIEHIIDEVAFRHFRLLTEALENRMDCKKLKQYLEEAFDFSRQDEDIMVLSTLPISQDAEIIHFGKNLKNLTKLEDKGIKLGEKVRLFEILGKKDQARIRLSNDDIITISLLESENIWVHLL